MRQWRFKSIADDDKCLHSAVKSSQPNSGSSWRMCPLLTNPKQKTTRRNSSWRMKNQDQCRRWEKKEIFKELLDNGSNHLQFCLTSSLYFVKKKTLTSSIVLLMPFTLTPPGSWHQVNLLRRSVKPDEFSQSCCCSNCSRIPWWSRQVHGSLD